jgi:hypothetical protein
VYAIPNVRDLVATDLATIGSSCEVAIWSNGVRQS